MTGNDIVLKLKEKGWFKRKAKAKGKNMSALQKHNAISQEQAFIHNVLVSATPAFHSSATLTSVDESSNFFSSSKSKAICGSTVEIPNR
jgi:hypothetical protein